MPQEAESVLESYNVDTDNLSLSNKSVSFQLEVRVFES